MSGHNLPRVTVNPLRTTPFDGEDRPVYYGSHAFRLRYALSVLQNGRCCICGKEPPPLRHRGRLRELELKWNRLWLDHDHRSRMVRGLLCRDCNTYIMSMEFGGRFNADSRAYFGPLLDRARAHLMHVVMASPQGALDVVSMKAPTKTGWLSRMSRCRRCGSLRRDGSTTTPCAKCHDEVL